jgi:hypothetical protein
MAADTEWQALLAEVNSDRNPTADLIETSLYNAIVG